MTIIFKTLVGVGLVVFVLTWFSWFFVGGDASGGRVSAGHYYVNRKGHLIEVSLGAFDYSLWLNRMNDVSFPIAFLSGAYLAERKRRADRARLPILSAGKRSKNETSGLDPLTPGKERKACFFYKKSKKFWSCCPRRFLQRAPKGTKLFYFF